MTRPFQYDNFVQSQIAVGSGNSYTNLYNNSQPYQHNETSNGNQSRVSLKQKINELLGLCKQQNEGIKTQFVQVMGAQKQILDLMKQQLDQPQKFNNYARSNVQMFPGVNHGTSVGPIAGYEGDPRQRSHQSFPLDRSGHQSGRHHYQNDQGQPYPNQQQNNIGGQGKYLQGYGGSSGGFGPQQGYHGHQGNFGNNDQNYYQPSYGANDGHEGPHQGYYPQRQTGTINQNGGYDDPYGTQYAPSNPLIPQQGLGQGYHPNDRANILKSKVQELKQQNNRLKNMANQGQTYQANQGRMNNYDDDPQTRQLQQEIARLRAVVQDYQNQLNHLQGSPQMQNKSSLLRQLKDQGEKIRQDTLTLLRNKSLPNRSMNAGGAAYNQSANFGGAGNYGQANFKYPTQPHANQQFLASGVRSRDFQSLSANQQAQLRSQLNQLRLECEQLHNENANIKRISKGTTQFTSGSRRI